MPAGGSCTVNVQYKPTATAVVGTTYRANVSFNLNTATQPVVTLTGIPSAAAKVYYLHTDHLDTPRSITNTAGQEVWRWDNTDPFGNNLANENPSALGTFTFNLRFPGQYFDKETGLHYNVNRDYNPALGRYIQSDPIGLRGGINTYGYVGGNPLSFADPRGLRRPDQEDPTTPENCAALKEMLSHFDKKSAFLSVMVGSYNAAYGDNLFAINVPYQTILGPVDADWMFRTYAYGFGGDRVSSNVIFYSAKAFWNVVNGTPPWAEMNDPSYTNAPNAMAWLVEHQNSFDNAGLALRKLFAPALQKCSCGK